MGNFNDFLKILYFFSLLFVVTVKLIEILFNIQISTTRKKKVKIRYNNLD